MAGEAVLSSFMQVLFQKLAEAALDEIRSLGASRKREIKNLYGTLSTIQAFLEDAEEKQLKDKVVRGWLAKLKDVAYDMDELLDEYQAKALVSSLEGRAQRRRWKVVSRYFSCSLWYRLSFEHQITDRLEEMGVRLDEIARERNIIGLQMLDGTSRLETTERPQTSSLVDDLSVLGREDKENIVKMLFSSHHSRRSNVSILPIVGMGGLGKTTLAQLVYNDTRVKEYFELRMWVCVSENFDEIKLTKETLDSATNGSSFTNTTNMNLLQENLWKQLNGKLFLLVLDDVWNEDSARWSSFRKAFISGKRGSKIVVTTQNENVGRIMGGLPPYHLNRLSDKDCWTLFRDCAFVDGKSDDHPDLEEIGKEIVERLKGLPLAAKALGSLLYCKLEVRDWKNILKSEIWELPPDKNNILPALRLSYKHLPPHLKQCFAFCSVFHKDYVFKKLNLVQIWMALGFIQPQGKKCLEEIGMSYFDDLLSRSFFQPYKGNYVMHDAIHDLAHSISVGECVGLEDNVTQDSPERTHHVSFSCDNSSFTSFEQFYGFKKLRTLLLLRGYKSITRPVPVDLFLKLRCLRVVDLYRRDINVLPSSIGILIQLRYLSLSRTDITTLPSSISRLYNLQTLKLNTCNELTEIPKEVINLINLRHLEASTDLISNIAGLGKLTCLQKLDEFIVRKDKGHTIEELKGMTELKGHLFIRNLENVKSGEEAREAMIKTKEHLNTLHLEWSDRDTSMQDTNLDEEVLGGLQPHIEVIELTIKGYTGVKFPYWVGDPSFCYLQTIHISNCRKCRGLPLLGQLPLLRYLDIMGVYTVSFIGQEFCGNSKIGFPSLKELILEDMHALEEWRFSDYIKVFPCLTDLEIVDCPKVRVVPGIPPTLKRLKISETGLTTLPEVRDPISPDSSSSSSSLTTLYIRDCPNILSLRTGLLEQQLRALQELTIIDCQELSLLPVESFRHLASLKTLHIYNCPRLAISTHEGGLLPSSLEDIQLSSCSELINTLLPELSILPCLTYLRVSNCPDLYRFPEELPATLKYLGIIDCAGLHFLPARLQELSSLETLIIRDCPQISFLHTAGLPGMLQEIHINNCPLLKHGLQKNSGIYWPWIAHVSRVDIDGEQIKLS